MLEPGSRRLRRSWTLLIALLVVCGTACSSSPRIGTGDFASAQTRIVALVNATGEQIGAPAKFTPARTANQLPCYKRVLGYVVKHLSENHAEVPIVMNITGTADGASLLPRVERYWKSLGYKIDTTDLTDTRFPKIRTHVGDDLLVATGYVGAHEINLYGVTPCVKR